MAETREAIKRKIALNVQVSAGAISPAQHAYLTKAQQEANFGANLNRLEAESARLANRIAETPLQQDIGQRVNRVNLERQKIRLALDDSFSDHREALEASEQEARIQEIASLPMPKRSTTLASLDEKTDAESIPAPQRRPPDGRQNEKH